MKRAQLAINSISTRHPDLPTALRAYAAAGFTQVELWLKPVHDEAQQGRSVRELRRWLDDLGLRCIGGFETVVTCFAAGRPRQENHERLRQNAQLLAELGADSAVLVAGTDGPAAGEKPSDPLGVVAEGYAAAGELLAQVGVTLALEFNWSPVVKSLRGAVEVAQRAGRGNVGVLFDTAHFHCTPSKLAHLAHAGPWLKHVHVNDMRDLAPELCNCNSDRVLPGAGCLDLPAILGEVERSGYAGPIAIEMFNEQLWQLPVEEAAQQMYASLLPLCTD